MLLWIDTETTGLDPTKGALLEVALVVTDNQLNEVAASEWVLPFDPESIGPGGFDVDKFVIDMHTTNGLWVESARALAHLGVPNIIEGTILAECRKWTAHKSGPICGSTIAFDRAWLAQHMPAVAAHFTHRNFDVSVLGEMARIWAPEVWDVRPKAEAHRALPDIRASIELARYWRSTLPSVLR